MYVCVCVYGERFGGWVGVGKVVRFVRGWLYFCSLESESRTWCIISLVVMNMLSVQGISMTPAGNILTPERLLNVIYPAYVNPLDCIPDNTNFKLLECFFQEYLFLFFLEIFLQHWCNICGCTKVMLVCTVWKHHVV